MGPDSDTLVRAVRTRWWLIAVMVIVAVVAAQLLTARQEPSYRAVATATVAPSLDLEQAPELLRALETLERRTLVATFALLAGAQHTRQQAAAAVDLAPAALDAYRISAAIAPNTNVIRIEVVGPDPALGRDLANAVVEATAAEATQRYRLFSMQPLDPAVVPAGPVQPSGARNMVVAALVGLFVGLVTSVGVEVLAGFAARGTEDRRPVLAA